MSFYRKDAVMRTYFDVLVEIDVQIKQQNPTCYDLFVLKITDGKIRLVIIDNSPPDPDTVCLIRGMMLMNGLAPCEWHQITVRCMKVLNQSEIGEKKNGND